MSLSEFGSAIEESYTCSAVVKALSGGYDYSPEDRGLAINNGLVYLQSVKESREACLNRPINVTHARRYGDTIDAIMQLLHQGLWDPSLASSQLSIEAIIAEQSVALERLRDGNTLPEDQEILFRGRQLFGELVRITSKRVSVYSPRSLRDY